MLCFVNKAVLWCFFRMFMFLFWLCSGQNQFDGCIQFIWKSLDTKKTLYIQILGTNQKINFIFDCMGKNVVAGKSSVSDENRQTSIGIPNHKIANSLKLIFRRPGWTSKSRYLLEHNSYNEMVWTMLKPDADFPLGSWKVSESLGFLAMLNSEPSQAIR